MEGWRPGCPGKADPHCLCRASPPGAPLHARGTRRAQFADDRFGKRGVYAPGGLQADAMAESRSFLCCIRAINEEDFGGSCAPPQLETRGRVETGFTGKYRTCGQITMRRSGGV